MNELQIPIICFGVVCEILFLFVMESQELTNTFNTKQRGKTAVPKSGMVSAHRERRGAVYL